MSQTTEYYRDYLSRPGVKERRRISMRRWHYQNKYGLSLEEAEQFLSTPCDMCHERPSRVIDHNHKTGKTRGGVCQRCNSLLVLLDTRGLLDQARDYFDKTYQAERPV